MLQPERSSWGSISVCRVSLSELSASFLRIYGTEAYNDLWVSFDGRRWVTARSDSQFSAGKEQFVRAFGPYLIDRWRIAPQSGNVA